MENLLEELKKPFPVDAISWRIGQKSKDKTKAKMLCYIDARDVMDRLDEVCGENWQDDYKEVKGRVVCTITIGGISRSDGAGDTDFEGEKGGLSDAFKRAAVKWGIGRYLYNASEYNTWVDLLDDGGEEIPDYAVMDHKKNKDRLYKVAEKLSKNATILQKEEVKNPDEKTPAQKAAETRAKTKADREEALQKYDICVEYFKRTPEPTNEALSRAEAVRIMLDNLGLYTQANDLSQRISSYDTINY